ncbi:hypothetical protein AMJ57_00880 [Parcubacteria bacterium SG8_24]|nr:MAG: hypothetical protein AMJ57_00880 [Parcubacteria bacterium SG8_24]
MRPGDSNRIRFVGAVLALIAGMGLGVYAVGHAGLREAIAAYGYPGLFVISVFSGFNILVPIPAVAFLPLFVVSGLDIRLAIVVMAVGVTIADLIAFLVGRTGRKLVTGKMRRAVRRLERIRERHYWAPIGLMFIYAIIAPFPNEVLAIPLGLMGYRLAYVAAPLLLGNLLFTALTSFGIMSVFSVL